MRRWILEFGTLQIDRCTKQTDLAEEAMLELFGSPSDKPCDDCLGQTHFSNDPLADGFVQPNFEFILMRRHFC